jgi:proteic killer suppression protein
MIRSFRYKGLEDLFRTGSKAGIRPDLAAKLLRAIDRLDASVSPRDMNLPAFRLHALSGDMAGRWSIWVTGNWRLTFAFEEKDAVAVDLVDYH